ncbi:hypothetical protein [Paenibacillus sp. MBLB4367]|uniref:hypothetical protein n=1 Tax=Paenibacillus sp. MBLB4367 TaxID=3384767 RepID=UPI0039082DCB
MKDRKGKPGDSFPQHQTDDLTDESLEQLARKIALLPEPPPPRGFVESAMANWRKSQRVLPPPVMPAPFSFRQKVQTIYAQGLWKDIALGLLLFVGGIVFLLVTHLVPSTLILPIVGCIPLLVVLSNTARLANCGMSELTRSLRLPLQWYMQARLLAIGMISLVINGITLFVLYPAGEGALMLRLALLWSIPTLLNTAAALSLAARIRNFGQLAAMLVLLPVCWLVLLTNQSVINWTVSIDIVRLGGLAALAALLLGGSLIINGSYLKKGGFLHGA